MKIKIFNPTTGDEIADNPSGFSFGNVVAGQHSDIPVLIKPELTDETGVDTMKVYLENDGGLANTEFGYFVSDNFTSGIDHSNYLSDHFVTGSGVDIAIDGGEPTDYVWLDINPDETESGSVSDLNYRFVFEYN